MLRGEGQSVFVDVLKERQKDLLPRRKRQELHPTEKPNHAPPVQPGFNPKLLEKPERGDPGVQTGPKFTD